MMNKGSGRRNNAYFRIAKDAKDAKGAYDAKGNLSHIKSNTHFDINPETLTKDIQNIIKNIKK